MIGAIEQTELNLWQVLDRVAVPIFITDRQHRVVFANRAFCQRSHYTLPEFAENIERILSSELRENESIFLNGTQTIQSGYLYDATGITQEISLVKAITYSAAGQPYIIATIHDLLNQPKVQATQLEQEIQERKAAEAALIRSQQRLTLLIQQSPFMFVEWTASYKVQTWNATAERVFGYRRSEAVGRSLDEILPELAREEVLDQIAPLLTQSGVTQQIQSHRTHSGQALVCEWYHYPLLAPNGSVMSIVSMGINITDRVQIEMARLESEKRLSLLIQHAPLAIIEWTPEFIVKEWNPAAEEIFGSSRSEAIGQHCDRWIPENTRPKVHEVADQLVKRKGGTYNINDNLRSDGKIITCEWHNNQILDADGNVIGIVSMVTDITDRIRLEAEREQTAIALKQSESQLRQQAQELETAFKQLQKTQAQLIQNEKMSSLGQLVAGIAHEINNPVSFIYGNVDPAKEYIEELLHIIHLYQADHPTPSDRVAEEIEQAELEFLQQDLFKLLDSMASGAERIRDIVRSLRSFSRHDEADLKAVDLHEGIDSTLMLLQHLLKSNRVSGNPILRPTIRVIKHYDELSQVQCYAGLLNQVFMNIFTNAIGAIHARWQAEEMDFVPTIEIQTSRFQAIDSSEWVRISIADNGIGMSAETHRRLFDPFFTTKAIGQGSGLGLSVSYQIVTEQHGGRLKCCRASDRGASFVIEIPVKQLMWS
ncbi:PAS domain S-box protein [Pseudanabaenaceae cyanobacterium LEGE 13415]|nr:PAS domain S-box protein [Pseudanabaenaceae cyanobacterium LEGE 13415]